jgi:hypothetical protein
MAEDREDDDELQDRLAEDEKSKTWASKFAPEAAIAKQNLACVVLSWWSDVNL